MTIVPTATDPACLFGKITPEAWPNTSGVVLLEEELFGFVGPSVVWAELLCDVGMLLCKFVETGEFESYELREDHDLACVVAVDQGLNASGTCFDSANRGEVVAWG